MFQMTFWTLVQRLFFAFPDILRKGGNFYEKNESSLGQHLYPDRRRHRHPVSAAGQLGNRRSERRFRGVGPVAHFHPAAPRLEIQPHVPAASGSTVSKAMTMLT